MRVSHVLWAKMSVYVAQPPSRYNRIGGDLILVSLLLFRRQPRSLLTMCSTTTQTLNRTGRPRAGHPPWPAHAASPYLRGGWPGEIPLPPLLVGAACVRVMSVRSSGWTRAVTLTPSSSISARPSPPPPAQPLRRRRVRRTLSGLPFVHQRVLTLTPRRRWRRRRRSGVVRQTRLRHRVCWIHFFSYILISPPY